MQQQMIVQPIISQRAERKTRSKVRYICICGDMGPSPDRLKDVKPFKIKCAGRGTPPAVRSDDRRALGTVQQLLEKPTQDDAADEGLMKSKSNESKLETKPEARKTEETDKDRRKRSAVNSRTFNGSTPVEPFLQKFRGMLNIIKRRRRKAVCK